MYYISRACQHGGLQHGRSLEHCILLSAGCLEDELLCASHILIFSDKFINLLFFELNDPSPKRKHHIVGMCLVKTLYFFSYIRPDFSNPHHGCAVARHIMRLTRTL